MELKLATQSYKSDSLPLSAQRLLNGYAESQPSGTSAPIAVWGQPGIRNFATLPQGPVRGGIQVNGVAYLIGGISLYTVSLLGVVTLVGSGITGNSNVSMDTNGVEILITNGKIGYSYLIASNSFVQISDPNYLPSNTVANIKSQWVADIANSNQIQISNLLDGRTWQALNRASAEANADYVNAVANRRGQLLVIGAATIEFWTATGNAIGPFQPIPGALSDKGILAPLSFCQEDEAGFYLANDFIFYRLAGFQKQRISTFALEQEWRSYATFSDAFSFVYTYKGHKFVILTFPSQNRTFCYDIATGLWNERYSYDYTTTIGRWRASCVVDCYGMLLVGDSRSGKVGIIDGTISTEFGDPIILQGVFPPIYNQGLQFSMPRFELDIDTGGASNTGQGSNPHVMLDWSDDGGYTFSSPQLWNSCGTIGNTRLRLQWNQLGSSYERFMRVTISDPIKRVIRGARAAGLYFDDAP